MSARGVSASLLAALCGSFCTSFFFTNASAAPLYIDVSTVTREVVGNGSATGTILAYTDDNGKVNTGHSLFTDQPPPVYSGKANAYATETIPVAVPGVGGFKFTPPVGLLNFPKQLAADIYNFAESINNETLNKATLRATARIERRVALEPKTNPRLIVSANSEGKNKLFAAARAADPIEIGPGTLELEPKVQINIGFRPGDVWSGAETGEGLASLDDPLWSLSVYVTGPLLGSADLIIDFVSDEDLGLDDDDIEAALRTKFTVAGGEAKMNAPYTLFNAFYSVPDDDVYSNYLNGSIASVPEPASVVLFVSGIAVVAAAHRIRTLRRRKEARG